MHSHSGLTHRGIFPQQLEPYHLHFWKDLSIVEEGLFTGVLFVQLSRYVMSSFIMDQSKLANNADRSGPERALRDLLIIDKNVLTVCPIAT